MATRQMYLLQPDEFLLWYFKRFASYRHVQPNEVHHWLYNKNLITQNIDGLDCKAGNDTYIPIHGRLDKVSVLHEQGMPVSIEDAPWEDIARYYEQSDDEVRLKAILLDAFSISRKTLTPEPMVSLSLLCYSLISFTLKLIASARQKSECKLPSAWCLWGHHSV